MKPILLSSLLVSTAISAELTIVSAPLESSVTVEATFLPTDATAFSISPKQWRTFTITKLADHGTAVKGGEVLITFENEDYLKGLSEAKETAKTRKNSLAKAEQELADLNLTTPHSLEGLKLAHDRAVEALADFQESGQALSLEDINERLDSSKRMLSYQEEELKQLLKMYEEDGVTEETEEIILKRQRSAVKSAKFMLKKAEKKAAWDTAKTIPRKAVDLKRAHDSTRLAYETGKISLPRALEVKTLAVAKMKRDHAEADRKLAELEADGSLFSLVAPADGVIYYGDIDHHSWSIGNTSKFLFENGSAPKDTVLMTLIPTGSVLTLSGAVAQTERLQIPTDATGTTTVAGLANSAFPTSITTLAKAPSSGGKYQLTMAVQLPEDSPLVTGMTAKVNLITYRNEDAISVPTAAITTKDGTSTVKVKMASGKAEVREITLGRVADKKTEIIEGLEVDQVIIIPEKKK